MEICRKHFAVGIWTDTMDGTHADPNTNLYCAMVKYR